MNDEEVLRYADQQISPADGAPASKAVPASSLPNAFRREGDTWLIDYEGQSCRLRDAKGLRYLAVLLVQPGREIHVADLAGAGDLPTSGAGARLDSAAREAYKARIAELEDEIDEASTWSDDERAARARAELDAIAGELTAAYGIGGRAREEADPVERIRKAVTNRIRDAIGRLEAEHPALGRHLRNGIRTGTFCSYAPEREKSWEVP